MAHFCAAAPLLVEPNQATLLLSALTVLEELAVREVVSFLNGQVDS